MRPLFGEQGNFVPNGLSIMWFVENIDGIFAEFLNKDIKIEDPLRTHSYGLRKFSFFDINGYYIRVAQGI